MAVDGARLPGRVIVLAVSPDRAVEVVVNVAVFRQQGGAAQAGLGHGNAIEGVASPLARAKIVEPSRPSLSQ